MKTVWRFTGGQLRIKRTARFQSSVMRYVYSDATDEQVVRDLRPVVDQDRRAAREMGDYAAGKRSGYLGDRVFRVLNAALADTKPEPIPEERAEAFARERDLGDRTLKDAYGQLERLVPELTEIAAAMAAEGAPTHPDGQVAAMPPMPIKRIKALVGPKSSNAHPLVRSDLALSVVVAYMRAVGGGRNHLDLTAPFFEQRRARRPTPVDSGPSTGPED
jgi:hypothetical protein